MAILLARGKSLELETKWAVDTSKWITPPLETPGEEVEKATGANHLGANAADGADSVPNQNEAVHINIHF